MSVPLAAVHYLNLSFTTGETIMDNQTEQATCDGRQIADVCDHVSAMLFDTITASLSFTLNVVHLAILLKFYKANNNITFLIKLAISDLMRSFTVILTSNCPAQRLLLQSHALCTISAIINDVLVALTLASLVMASIDRYLVVCKPFEYTESRFIEHFNKITICVWLAIAVFITGLNWYISGACVLGSKMCSTYSTKPVYILYLFQAFLFVGAALVIISICYARIFKEFFSMMRKLKLEAKHTKKMSIVVGTITAMFFMLYLPIVLGVVVTIAGKELGHTTWIYLYSLLTIHGIVNVLTYGWQKKDYRKHLRVLFCCENSVSVDPSIFNMESTVQTKS